MLILRNVCVFLNIILVLLKTVLVVQQRHGALVSLSYSNPTRMMGLKRNRRNVQHVLLRFSRRCASVDLWMFLIPYLLFTVPQVPENFPQGGDNEHRIEKSAI